MLFRTALAASLVIGITLSLSTSPQAQARAPKYEVDATWPKPLPERWVLGGLGGLCVDNRDHVLILNRQDVLDTDLNAGYLAPAIIEFDPAGNVVNSWGDLKAMDPRLHSCFFDHEDNVWIASAPSGMIEKYTHDGSKRLLQVGKKGVFDSSDGTVKGKPMNSNAAQFFGPASIHVDPTNGDVYVADGENPGWNHRVVVLDRTGKFLRQWQPKGMQIVHCLAGSSDGLIYVCDRQADGIQVYDKQGSLLKTFNVRWKQYTPSTDGQRPAIGNAAAAIALSRDREQKFIYVLNQTSAQIEIMDRQSGEILGHFGGGVGHYLGQFDQPHGIAADSKGNVYIAENRGKRVQKFKIVGK
jgi:DNA-binding beta-propeller fold protein YncE